MSRTPQPADGSCGAKTRNGGKCKMAAGAGTDHLGIGRCKLHGGASPNAQLTGVVELARREAAVMGRPLDIAPGEALLQCIRIAAGEVQYASDRIAELDVDDAIVGQRTVKTRPLSEGKDGESPTQTVEEVTVTTAADLHIWIHVRRQALDRLVNYSAVALKAGVEERRVKIAEQTGQLIANVIRGVLTDLGVADHPEAPNVVRRHLQLVA